MKHNNCDLNQLISEKYFDVQIVLGEGNQLTTGEVYVKAPKRGKLPLAMNFCPLCGEPLNDAGVNINAGRLKQTASPDADKLRRNTAKYLAELYAIKPVWIANLCDEQLDRTGALLGYVRDEAAKLENEKKAE